MSNSLILQSCFGPIAQLSAAAEEHLTIPPMYFVYVIESESKKHRYIGQTEDLITRLYQHNNNVLGRFTKNKGPWSLLYCEEYSTRSQAMKREKYLKTGVGRDYLKRILSQKNNI